MDLTRLPYMVMADSDGNVFEHPRLRMAVASGRDILPAPLGELISLPPGTDLHVLPGRRPVGIDPGTGAVETVDRFDDQPVYAASAFLPPAHTVLYRAAFSREPDAPVLPLFAYAGLGWDGVGLVAPAVRVDQDTRQDLDNFPPDGAEDRAAAAAVAQNPGNRLLAHLAHCCTVYRCPAARNLFLERHEAPLPTSTACNARCVGCISLQEGGCVPSTQDRIGFQPTAQEVAQVALRHLERAEDPIVSFGQGCEGEPLTVWPLLEEAVSLIRRSSGAGTINLNTNAGNPEALRRLFEAGLDSIRVSMNSARPELYERYFRPANYGFADVVRSMKTAGAMGKFMSVNYFVFPGLTDEEAEFEALMGLMAEVSFDMIQWRNLNIDPDLYMDSIRWEGTGRPLGISTVMERFHRENPGVRYGYFNPFLG